MDKYRKLALDYHNFLQLNIILYYVYYRIIVEKLIIKAIDDWFLIAEENESTHRHTYDILEE